MVAKTLVNFIAAKRIPLIKFRKGGNVITSGTTQQPNNAAGVSSVGAQKPVMAAKGAIEDWQLPARYRRKPIDPIEMEYINRGGPA